jgi:hypothetical protein
MQNSRSRHQIKELLLHSQILIVSPSFQQIAAEQRLGLAIF